MFRLDILIFLPLIAGLAALVWRSRIGRRVLLVAVATIHLLTTLSLWTNRPQSDPQDWLAVDDPGLLFLSITSVLFLAASIYTVGYLQQEYARRHRDTEEGFLFRALPNAVFTGCLLLFLGAMSGATLSQHFGLFWVFMEGTTLASAPLIYFHRHHRSLEATWKYIMICSVGIALALLGNFMLAVSARGVGGPHSTLLFPVLLANADELHPIWLKVAFIFILVGYGTKMGLAPMHSQLPDADSEAPPAVAALLSGALLNCAFLGIFRVHLLCVGAGLANFSQELLVGIGLLSMGVSAIFIIRQQDFRRMLAYSSVEHMGVIALGVGLGGLGVFGAALHAIGHSLTKGALFMTAGNIFTAFDSKFVRDVKGLKRARPITAVLWMGGFLAITGSPPFSTFLSEFTILKAALDGGHGVVAALYLTLLGIIFIGMVNNVFPMTQGNPPEMSGGTSEHELLWSWVPPATLATLVLLLGIWLPKPLEGLLQGVAEMSHSSLPVAATSVLDELHPQGGMPDPGFQPTEPASASASKETER